LLIHGNRPYARACGCSRRPPPGIVRTH
jgi:hypothetical protein